MSNERLTPLEIVQRYYDIYLEYEQAFNNNPFDESKTQEALKKVIESGADFDSKEFEDTVIDLMIEKPTKRTDVNNAALRFYLYADFYTKTQTEDLPEKLKKEYEISPFKTTLKSFYSIDKGNFIKNEDAPITLEKEKLRALYQSLQEQK